MDHQIQKMKDHVEKYLGKSSSQILAQRGKPEICQNNDIWIYRRYKRLIFRDEICFLLTDAKVTDIVITEYMFGVPLYNLFYYEGQTPEFKISPIQWRFNKFFHINQ